MTKAEQIRKLHDGKRSTQEIAEIVGCHRAYVRAAIERNRSGGLRSYDRAYSRMWAALAKQHGCRQAAREAYRAAYQQEIRSKSSRRTVKAKAASAYANALRKTAFAKFCTK